MEGFRHRQANDACSLSDVQQVWTDGGITLACADCGGLVEMPCPYCDYVRFPNKSGLGMSLHILSHALGRGRRGWWWPIPEQRAEGPPADSDVRTPKTYARICTLKQDALEAWLDHEGHTIAVRVHGRFPYRQET